MPRIDVAEPPEVSVIVELLRVVLGPEGEIDVERLIVPLNPFRLVTVMVELSVEDRERERDDGSAEMEKSGFTATETDTVAGWEREPLEPVTVTVYVPVGVEDCVWTVRVEVPVLPDDSVRLVGFRDAVGPAGETVEDRLTVPVKPPALVSEMVDVADDPGETFIDAGLAEMLKSGVGGVD